MVVAPVRLGLLHAGSFGVVYVLRVISSVYALKLQEISPTLILVPSAYLKTKMWKRNNGFAGFKNQGALKFI